MYDYFQIGNESSFSPFEAAVFSLLKRQPDCSTQELSRLFLRVKNVDELPISMSENFIEWRGSMQLESISQLWFYRKTPLKTRYIGLLPIGPFPESIIIEEVLSLLTNWLSCFFMGYRVECLQTTFIKDLPGLVSRYHSKTKKFQVLSSSLMKQATLSVSDFSYECLVVLSWHDLYPDERLNFELGQGNTFYRCAVMCFGRFEPNSFVENQLDLEEMSANLIWKILKVSAHEVCHVFGMKHCNVFQCLMNGSSSIRQAMDQPLLLCPSCLRKLKHFTKANIEHWFVGVRIFLKQVLQKFPDCQKLSDCVQWLDQLLSTEIISSNEY